MASKATKPPVSMVKRQKILTDFMNGASVYDLAKEHKLAAHVIYSWFEVDCPNEMRWKEEMEGADIPGLMVHSMRSKLDLELAFERYITDGLNNENPDVITWIKGMNIADLSVFLRGISGSALRIAACLNSVSNSVGNKNVEAPAQMAQIEQVSPNELPVIDIESNEV